MMRISQLAERSGVPATTLRYYESAGLLAADRSPAGYRLYGEEAVERLAFIGAAKHLGLPLDEISELLAVWESGACAEVKADLRTRIAARIADAEARVAELAGFITTLHRSLEHLDTLPDRPGRCDPECGFLALLPSRQAAQSRPERWRLAPVACSLDSGGLAERTAQWRRLIDGALRQETEDGIRLTLPADRAGDIATLAAAEQRCCPFFDFRLHLDGPVLHLRVRVPAEGMSVLTEVFGPAA